MFGRKMKLACVPLTMAALGRAWLRSPPLPRRRRRARQPGASPEEGEEGGASAG